MQQWDERNRNSEVRLSNRSAVDMTPKAAPSRANFQMGMTTNTIDRRDTVQDRFRNSIDKKDNDLALPDIND